MKITIELDTEKDGEEYVQLITNVGGVHALIWGFEDYLRRQIKYVDRILWPDAEELRDKWYDLKSENGVVTE